MLIKLFPFAGWFKNYGPGGFKADAVSGLTVALVLIPQSMAYAQLAGLPVHYGLYASFLPPLIAALFGSSRQLATGPVAVVSLVTAASLEPLATAGSSQYIAYAILLALMVGLVQFLLGLFRAGVVTNFLSHPVLIGFSNAAALIIFSSQLPKLFGVQVDKGDHQYETVIRVIDSALHYTHLPTLIIGLSAFVLMLGLKMAAPRFPGILAVVALSIGVSHAIGLEHNHSTNIGRIRSPQARDVIWQYSIQSTQLANLTRERTQIRLKLAKLPKGGSQWITTWKDIDLLAHRIRVARSKASAYRRQIRHMLFEKIPPGGASGYYLVGHLPAEQPTDGRIWRLNVGARPLDPTDLTMIGGGAVVGAVPGGLPRIQIPALDLTVIKTLISYAVIIALLGFMEAISIAKAMAAKTGDRIDPNRELIGQGLGNICGAFGQSFPTSGSFSRSAVNLQSGAVTGMASVITSLAVMAVLLFFTPLLYHLPQSVLAAIIMMAVLGLVNFRGFVHSWKAQWSDGVIAVITFGCTLYFAPHLDNGILAGVALSLVVFLYKSMRPQVVSLSRGEDKNLHAALTHGLKQCRYIDMIRFDGPLFFANADYLEDQIIDHMESKKKLKHIIIESSGISIMDASGEEALSLIVDRVRSAGIEISFSGVHQNVIEVMTRTGMIKKIGVDRFFPNIEMALNAVWSDAHQKQDEKEGCPLRKVIYQEEVKSGETHHNLLEKLHSWRIRHN